ncbi:MAG: hypothetical protein JXM69_05775 [Anaerolineae bacterium]|nr:hypothetical protein [Anaerolineae bacterium]
MNLYFKLMLFTLFLLILATLFGPAVAIARQMDPELAATATPSPRPWPSATLVIKTCLVCEEESFLPAATPSPTSAAKPGLAPLLPVIAPDETSPAPANQMATTSTARILYFYATDCPHCHTVEAEVLDPLSAKYGLQVEIKMIEISAPANYELLIRAEEMFGISSDRRGIPTLIIGDQALIGEEPIRAQLPDLVEQGLAKGGVDWPALPGLETVALADPLPQVSEDAELCAWGQQDNCDTNKPVWAAYFYQVGCPECSLAEIDLKHVRNKYPQLVVEEFNIYDQAALGQWLAGRVNRTDLNTPAIFIGADALIGNQEITPQNLERLVTKYTAEGAEKVWDTFDPTQAQRGLLRQFESFGPLAVVAAGLIDGLNPCAFATLVFFVSYLSLSGRKGREVLAVGISFTVGVFLAYLMIGLGFYKVLDLLGDLLTTLRWWVYALTALLCAGLAVFSFLDFLKARRGKLGDMSLNLPHSLRLRINAVIRQGRHTRAYVAGAFVTGIIISFLELACTGQIYLPTIVFVSSIPEMRMRAIGYLVLYNLLFILPLVVVFVLVYYGTTSKQLSGFLEEQAAVVKLGMTVLFTTLAAWLVMALLI